MREFPPDTSLTYDICMIGDLTQSQMEDILGKIEHADLACHADGETYCIPTMRVGTIAPLSCTECGSSK